MSGKKYILNLLISIDQFFNTIFGGNPDETISSRWAKRRFSGCWLCYYGCLFLHWLDPNHCEKSIELDEK